MKAHRLHRAQDHCLPFPPGTSKWNKIDHRLVSFISTNWPGRTLISHEVTINLIAGTTTSTGLRIYAQLDDRPYPGASKSQTKNSQQ